MGNGKGAYLGQVLNAFKLVVDIACLAATFDLLVLFALQFPHSSELDSAWLIQFLRLVGDPGLTRAASILGWGWPAEGISFLPVVAGFSVLLLRQALDALLLRLRGLAMKKFPPLEKTRSLSESSSSEGISVSSTTLAMAKFSEEARAKIQRRHARVARMLSVTKHRKCAFLSIDVVDPDAMKKGMDPQCVARSFKAYADMLEDVFSTTHAWKEAWTPDGVMVCYLEVKNATQAAYGVLHGLVALNAGGNELDAPFRVRCGINVGEVVIFDDSKLEKIADHVIDVAGHMQKHARPNSLWLSEEVYGALGEKGGFHPVNTQVDGHQVVEWRM